MGEVFEVEHIEFGKRFALKKLTSASAAHPDSLKRFRREARAASAVGHPGIVEVIDFGTDEDGSAFLVMELLTGESLRARLDRLGRLDEHEAVDIGRELLVCLAAAHDAGV